MSEASFSPNNTVYFPQTRELLKWIRRESIVLFDTIGLATLNSSAMLKFLFQGKLNRKHFFDQAAFVGIDTLGIALVLTTSAAMVISLQLSKEMVRQGAGSYVGALVSFAMLRELAPIMTAVAVVSMAGSAFAAELSTMQITKQVDALRVLHVHPIRYLVLPRVLGCAAMMPLMTLITSVCGIVAGMFISYFLADINFQVYLDSVWNQTEMKDVFCAMLKASVFGYIIAILSATIGINTHGGAKEVGIATTRAVVWSFLSVAIFDYLLTYIIYGSN